MKSTIRFADILITFVLALVLSMPLSARVTSPTAPVVVKQNAAAVNPVDLDNPPLLTKYAHGLKVGSINHNILPAGPTEPKAHQLFFQAQDFQQKGFAYLMYGYPKQAIMSLNKARILWPDSAATYRWLAEAYEANGQPSSAIVNYRLLFYGWPNRNSLNHTKSLKLGEVPADKPSDYNRPDPETTDPTLLMQFSLLLQQAGQDDEARAIYDRGTEALRDKFGNTKGPLSPFFSDELTSPKELEVATRTALAINQMSYQDKKGAQENLKKSLQLQPENPAASYHLEKLR